MVRYLVYPGLVINRENHELVSVQIYDLELRAARQRAVLQLNPIAIGLHLTGFRMEPFIIPFLKERNRLYRHCSGEYL